MEIQHGKGPWAPPVSGIVPLGSTLTLVVAINDYRGMLNILQKVYKKKTIFVGEFDMRVKSCAASDGAGHVIKLSDDYGCVLRPKMISKFLKARAPDERASVITYAFFHAFKFPDALSVHIKCKVEICRHGCLDHCQTSGTPGNLDNSLLTSGSGSTLEGLLDRKDTLIGPSENDNSLDNSVDENEQNHDHDIFYDDIIHKTQDYTSNKRNKEPAPVFQQDVESDMEDIESLFLKQKPVHEMLKKQPKQQMSTNKRQGSPQSQKVQPKTDDDVFPHGPRQLHYAQNRAGLPMAGPRALDLGQLKKEQGKRKTRSVKITNRETRNADVGVSGLYDVISEADLAFEYPDTKQESVTVFQGKISEEVVYGICLPVQGFSIIFILVISLTIIAALVAGSLLYRYQLQKDTLAHQQANTTPMHANTVASWMTMRLFRTKHPLMTTCTNDIAPSTISRQTETIQ